MGHSRPRAGRFERRDPSSGSSAGLADDDSFGSFAGVRQASWSFYRILPVRRSVEALDRSEIHTVLRPCQPENTGSPRHRSAPRGEFEMSHGNELFQGALFAYLSEYSFSRAARFCHLEISLAAQRKTRKRRDPLQTFVLILIAAPRPQGGGLISVRRQRILRGLVTLRGVQLGILLMFSNSDQSNVVILRLRSNEAPQLVN